MPMVPIPLAMPIMPWPAHPGGSSCPPGPASCSAVGTETTRTKRKKQWQMTHFRRSGLAKRSSHTLWPLKWSCQEEESGPRTWEVRCYKAQDVVLGVSGHGDPSSLPRTTKNTRGLHSSREIILHHLALKVPCGLSILS